MIVRFVVTRLIKKGTSKSFKKKEGFVEVEFTQNDIENRFKLCDSIIRSRIKEKLPNWSLIGYVPEGMDLITQGR